MPGKYPKEYIQYSKHGESLKSRILHLYGEDIAMHIRRLEKLRILHTLHPALEDGTDTGFRNVGKPQSDAGEIPKRIHATINCPSIA